MTAISDLFIAFVLLSTFFIAGVIVVKTAMDQSVAEIQISQTSFEKDLYETSVDSILMISENNTRKSFGSLLTDLVYYKKKLINNSGDMINLSDQLKPMLDYAYGEGKYYFSIEPKVDQIILYFVFDGSNSLKEERDILAAHLGEVIDDVEEDYDIPNHVEVRVLSTANKQTEDAAKCTGRLAQGYNCQLILDDKYDCYGEAGNICFDEPAVAVNRAKEAYSRTDWAAGSAYMVDKMDDSRFSILKIIFPVSDELSTSSIPDQCLREHFAYITSMTTCDVCNLSGKDTVNRSLARVNKLIELVGEKQGLVMYPINAAPYDVDSCEYDYDNVKGSIEGYFERVYGPTITPAGLNFCGDTYSGNLVCGGCTETVDESLVCFHPEVWGNISYQMQMLGNSTDFGGVIRLQNVADLPNQINVVINNVISSLNFKIGEYWPDRERVAIIKVMPLAVSTSEAIYMKLWVYEDEAGLINESFAG